MYVFYQAVLGLSPPPKPLCVFSFVLFVFQKTPESTKSLWYPPEKVALGVTRRHTQNTWLNKHTLFAARRRCNQSPNDAPRAPSTKTGSPRHPSTTPSKESIQSLLSLCLSRTRTILDLSSSSTLHSFTFWAGANMWSWRRLPSPPSPFCNNVNPEPFLFTLLIFLQGL